MCLTRMMMMWLHAARKLISFSALSNANAATDQCTGPGCELSVHVLKFGKFVDSHSYFGPVLLLVITRLFATLIPRLLNSYTETTRSDPIFHQGKLCGNVRKMFLIYWRSFLRFPPFFDRNLNNFCLQLHE